MADAASRRTVTVLFCDLEGSTRLGEQLDPEPLRMLLSRWYEAVRAPVDRNGGTVEKFIGDAVMAVFGIPHVHEDDALRAVRAAVEMREATAQLAAELDSPLRIRIGVNSGEVITGEASTTLVTGDAVNTAKRLEEAADEGEILIGEPTRVLVENAVELDSVPAVDAKGKRAPVTAWRVRATIPDAPAFARRLDAPLVGRVDELALLRAELAAVERDRSCRLVTVYGAAGIGKSRLAGELVGEAAGRGTVLTGRCVPYGDGATFLPLADLVRSAGGEEAVLAAVAAEADAPLIEQRLRGALGTGESAASSEEAFWAVRRLLETLARERPVVVCFEDVHWAAPTFLDLLEYVVGWSRDAPILLLCLARSELLDERPRWPGTALVLEALAPDEAAALIDELAQSWPLAPESRAGVVETAEGNPLFLEQLVAMLAHGGVASSLPPTIQALLAARLDQLGALERTVLERASVIGREFPRGAVVELSSAEERAVVGATLLQLVRKELVQPEPSIFPGDDGFRFRHALIRDAAYAALPKTARADLHERAASWLEQRDGEDELVGYHLEQAFHLQSSLLAPAEVRRDLAARAHRLLGGSGRRAYERGNVPAARNLLERALALDAPDDDRLELRREHAHVRWQMGDTEAAIEEIDAVAADATAAGNRAQEWYARLDAAGMRGVGAGSTGLLEFLETAARAVEVFSELQDDRGLAQGWRRISLAERVRCSYAAAEGAAERALLHAARCGDRQEASRAADLLCTTLLWGPVPVDDAIERCRALLADAAGNEPLRANVLAALGGLHGLRGDVEQARGFCREAEGIYSDLGLRMSIAGLTQVAGPLELLAGEPARAEALLRTGLELVRGSSVEGLQLGLLAIALLALGRLNEAGDAARTARATSGAEDVFAQVLWRQSLARVAAGEGDLEVAVGLAGEAVDLAALTDALTMHADALVDLGAVLDAAGRQEDAEEAVRRAKELYERKGNLAAMRAARSPGTLVGTRAQE